MANNFLISGQNVSGSGNGKIQATYWSNAAFVVLQCSGNSATATLWGEADDAGPWMKVTSWTPGVNTTSTAQITSFFQNVMATLDFASGGPITALVWLQYAPRRLQP